MTIEVKDANGVVKTASTLDDFNNGAGFLKTASADVVDALTALLTALGHPTQAGAVLPAGENHIGEVGGKTVVASATPVGSTAPYVNGDAIGGKLTFPGFGRIPGGSGLVQMASIHSKSAQTFACDLVLFHTDPAATVVTDNQPLVVAVADYDKILGVVHIADWTALGGPSFAEATQLAMAYKVATGSTDVFGILVSRGTPTLASASDLKVICKALLD